MFSKIIDLSVGNKLVVVLLTFFMAAWGVISFRSLPIDAVPDITNNQVQVITRAPDLAAQEMEKFITFPIEQALATIPGKIELRSFSRMGLSLVTIVFNDETDIYWARQQVSERLKEAETMIPPRVGKPELTPVTTGLGEIYQYVLDVQPGYEHIYSLSDLRTLQDWVIRRQLLGVEGLADISSFGGNVKQYEIAIRPEALNSQQISLQELVAAIEANNRNAGGSYLARNGQNLYLRAEGMIQKPEELLQINIARRADGSPVRLYEVADVKEGRAIRFGAMTADTIGEAVGGVVLMLKGANASNVIEGVKERIAIIQRSLPPGVKIKPYLDRTRLVNNALATVSKNLIEGALIVIAVLVLMLGNLRAGLVVASVIPLSMLFALICMNIFGVSGNLMSLGAIDFGLIVDAAVIIVESVVHALFLNGAADRASMDNVVRNQAGKMMRFAAFGQLIILIVYLPILSLSGIEGKMFRPMAETVAFAILGALLLSLTWVPVATALFLKVKPQHEGRVDRIMRNLAMRYQLALSRLVRFRISVLAAAVLLLVASLGLFTRLGAEFIPTLAEGDFAVETRVPLGSSLETTIEASLKAARILQQRFPEVSAVTGKIGTSEIPTDPMPVEACDLIISLKDKREWTTAKTPEALAAKMQEALMEIPGVSFGFQQPIQMRFNELMTGARQDVVVKVFGEDLDSLGAIAARIGQLAASVEGAEDVYVEQVVGLPQLIVRPNREAIARFGLGVEDVLITVQTAYAGASCGWIFEGERRVEIMVRLSETQRNDLGVFQRLSILSPQGVSIPLHVLATASIEDGPAQIQREDAMRRAITGFNVRSRDVASVVEELQSSISASLALPPGYTIKYGGQFRNLEEAVDRLSIAVPVALLLILVLLYFTFGSMKRSMLIFSAVPFSAIGGVAALWLRDMPFSISAGVGFIALFGVAVLNGIVLIGSFEEQRQKGRSVIDAVLHGAASRLRPVLMTALVASLGFLPMALAESAGAEVQRPLATVVIGGLVSATLLTLFLLPLLYTMSMKVKSTVTLALLAFVGFTSPAGAQTQTLTFDSVLSKVKRNHPEILKLQALSKEATAQKKAALDPGLFSLNMLNGQYNSVYTDLYFMASQNIPNPLLLRNEYRYSAQKSVSAQLSEQVAFRELEVLVFELWTNMLYTREIQALLEQQVLSLDSLYRIAQTQVSLGDQQPLSALLLKSEKASIEAELRSIQSRAAATALQLGAYCGLEAGVVPPANEQLKEQPGSFDVAPAFQTPLLRLAESRVREAGLQKALERSSIFPSFELGYFNQSLTGIQNINGVDQFFDRSNRFSGIQLSARFPLFVNAPLARTRAAHWRSEAAKQEFRHVQLQHRLAWSGLSAECNRQREFLRWMKNEQLPVAAEAVRVARIAYQSGELSISDLLRIQGQYRAHQLEYAARIQQYNTALFRLNQLQKP